MTKIITGVEPKLIPHTESVTILQEAELVKGPYWVNKFIADTKIAHGIPDEAQETSQTIPHEDATLITWSWWEIQL